MRTTRSNNGPFIPSANAVANAVADAAAAQITLVFDDNRLASLLLGQYGQHLALVERRLGVVADQRGNQVTIAEGAQAPAASTPISFARGAGFLPNCGD